MKPPPDHQIAAAPPLHDEETTARLRSARVERERREHDQEMVRAIARELAREWALDVARVSSAECRPPRAPGEGEVPAERFGPADPRRAARGS